MATCGRKRKGQGRRRRVSALHQLYQEFAQFYCAHRCRWAPENPRRLFNLCVKKVYPRYARLLSLEGFFSVVYDTLGVRRGDPRGLFQDFDPGKYGGKLQPPDHFVNFFRRRLWGKVLRALRAGAHRGRSRRVAPERSRRAQDLLESIPEALASLDQGEYAVIELTYWGGLSRRKVGLRMRVDHKTVGRRHADALRKLRRFFGLGPGAAAG